MPPLSNIPATKRYVHASYFGGRQLKSDEFDNKGRPSQDRETCGADRYGMRLGVLTPGVCKFEGQTQRRKKKIETNLNINSIKQKELVGVIQTPTVMFTRHILSCGVSGSGNHCSARNGIPLLRMPVPNNSIIRTLNGGREKTFDRRPEGGATARMRVTYTFLTD